MRRTTLTCLACAPTQISLVSPTPRIDSASPANYVSSRACLSPAHRLHRTLAGRGQGNTHAGQPCGGAVRTLFGGWGASASPIAVEAPAASSPFPSSNNNAAALAAPAATAQEVTALRQQIVDLKEALEASQETVKQLLILTSAKTLATATAATVAPCCDAASAAKTARGACYVVRTSEELVDALRGRGSEHASRTILLDGKFFFLDMYGKVEVDQARVSIVGNKATIVGHISVKGRGAVLAASDVFFLCSHDLDLRQAGTQVSSGGLSKTTVNLTGKKAKENVAHLTPVISATAGAGLHLDRCVLSNGRDGVYLGMGSHCTLNHVRIVNCIRGLYEGVGCRTSMVDTCVFQANRYHMVLLGPGARERVLRLYQRGSTPGAHEAAFTGTFAASATVADVVAPGLTTAADVALQQTKAEVVLQHSPITDIYEECWSDGQAVELTKADATAGLSDPLF